MATRFLIRVLDIVFALVGLVSGIPVLLTITLIGFCDTGSPLFLQQRVGRHRKPFVLVKFRTMKPDTASVASHLASADAITSFGLFLRRTKLDELPQLWNVFVGDLSLVGPRAYIPREVPQMRGLEGQILKCNPGITGLWQVSGRNQLSFDERVTIDVGYQYSRSLALDYYILLKTIPVVLTGHGAS